MERKKIETRKGGAHTLTLTHTWIHLCDDPNI